MAGKSKRQRHSYVRFFMDDWAGGTTRMTRLIQSVYFDICFYNWDKGKPMPEAEVMLTFADIAPQGDDIVAALVASGKLERNDEGVFNPRAIAEAEHAFEQWAARSRGGSHRQGKTDEGEQQESSVTPEGGEEEPAPAPAAPRRTFNSQSVVDAWNVLAKAHGLTTVQKLTDARRLKLNARLGEWGEEKIIAAIQTVPESSFLMGGGDRGWKANFNWLIQPESCAKLIERHSDYFGKEGGKSSAWRPD